MSQPGSAIALPPADAAGGGSNNAIAVPGAGDCSGGLPRSPFSLDSSNSTSAAVASHSDLTHWAQHLEQVVREVGSQHEQAMETLYQRVLSISQHDDEAPMSLRKFDPTSSASSASSASSDPNTRSASCHVLGPGEERVISKSKLHKEASHGSAHGEAHGGPHGGHHGGHLGGGLRSIDAVSKKPTRLTLKPIFDAPHGAGQRPSSHAEGKEGTALASPLRAVSQMAPSNRLSSTSAEMQPVTLDVPATLPEQLVTCNSPVGSEPGSSSNKKSVSFPPLREEDEEDKEDTAKICECGNAFLNDAIFCRKCGKPRPNACGSCGNILKHDALFCRRCGLSRDEAVACVFAKGPRSSEVSTTSKRGKEQIQKNRIRRFSDSENELKTNLKRMNSFKDDNFHQGGSTTSETDTPWQCQKLVRHPYFDSGCAVLLVTNAVFIGMQVNWQATAPPGPLPESYISVDRLYTVLFTIELLLRLLGVGPRGFFCKGEELSWNYFDSIIVLIGLIGILFDLIVSDSQGVELSNLSALRTIRVARILRVARVIRLMRFFRSLRILIRAIFNTVKSCVWTALLLCIIMYMFGIVFAQAVSEHLHDRSNGDVEYNTDSVLLLKYFGTLPRCIYTCFKSIMGGVDWEIATQALSDVGALYVFMFIVMVSFVHLAVMNVISGLFLQSSIEQAQQDSIDIIYQHQADAQKHAKNFTQMFKVIDSNGDGAIFLEDFEEAIRQPTLQTFLYAMEIESSDAWTLFKLLDADAVGFVCMDEFVDGCMQLKGSAKSIHVAKLVYENKWLMDALTDLAEYCSDCFEILSDQLQGGSEPSPRDSPGFAPTRDPDRRHGAPSSRASATDRLITSDPLRGAAAEEYKLPTPAIQYPGDDASCQPPIVQPPQLPLAAVTSQDPDAEGGLFPPIPEQTTAELPSCVP